jgi:putative hydrolases of HD superfamily
MTLLEASAGIDALFALKEVQRAGWLRAGVTEPESVAAHSWGMALIALLRCPPELDRERVLALCLLHDIGEAIIGDITPHDGISREVKRHRERAAAARLLGAWPRLWGLWEDYEQQRSPEARFVKELDRLDMALQAERYRRTRGIDSREFSESADLGLHRPDLRALLPGGEPG